MLLDFLLSNLKNENKTNYLIDIGAQVGPGPIFHLLRNPFFKGLCIEGAPAMYNQLIQNLPNPQVDKHLGFITPVNCLEIFESYNVPESPDILKIDIDGYDLSVLRVLLTKYKPKIIIAEINEKIPPPIHFEVKYNENYGWDTSHFFGFSLQAGHNVLSKLGYTIIKLFEGNNLVAINPNEFTKLPNRFPSINELYQNEYVLQYKNNFPWNADINHWLTISNVDDLKNDIFNYFTTDRKTRGLKTLGNPISPNAFVLEITKEN